MSYSVVIVVIRLKYSMNMLNISASFYDNLSTILGTKVSDPKEEIRVIKHGIPAQALKYYWTNYDGEKSLQWICVDRTYRRRLKDKDLLNPVQTQRLFRLARTELLAKEAFSSLEKARKWLRRENRVFDGATPLSMLETDIGAKLVEEELQKINYGFLA